jgi:uncharacterized protein (UPF0333 family)
MQKLNRQRGQILVEFILIAPALLAIAGGAIEIARFLRFNQTASIFSQEAAVAAYRKCSDFTNFDANGSFNSNATSSAIQLCLNDLRTQMQTRLNQISNPAQPINPEFLLVISVYRRDRIRDENGNLILQSGLPVGFNSLERIVSASAPFASPSIPLSSLFSPSSEAINRNNPLPATVVITAAETEKMERIVIAEVAYRYTPAIPIYRVLMRNSNFLRTNANFRETTIL